MPDRMKERQFAVTFTPDDMFGDTNVLHIPEPPSARFDPSRPRDVQIVEEFTELYADVPGGRTLTDFKVGSPFPDVVAHDPQQDCSVDVELTELAYEYWLQTKACERMLKEALYGRLVDERPKYRGQAMQVYFHTEGRKPRIPSIRGEVGKRFLDEFMACLRGTLSVTRVIGSEDPNVRPLEESTIDVPQYLGTLARFVREIRLGPNSPMDPRLPSPDDPYLVFNTQNIISYGEFPALFRRTLRRKVRRGPSYSADILIVHTWADGNVLVVVLEDGDPSAIGRQAVLETGAHKNFDEIWLYDLWRQEIWCLSP